MSYIGKTTRSGLKATLRYVQIWSQVEQQRVYDGIRHRGWVSKGVFMTIPNVNDPRSVHRGICQLLAHGRAIEERRILVQAARGCHVAFPEAFQ